MIGTACFLYILASQTADELGRVAAFVHSARIGLEEGIVLPPFPRPDELPRLESSLINSELRRRGWRVYTYAHATVYIESSTGRIVGYNDSETPGDNRNDDGSLRPRRVLDADAVALARRFYRTAGWPGTIDIVPNERKGIARDVLDGQGGSNESLEILGCPSVSGIRYDDTKWQVVFDVNRLTGQLENFYGPGIDVPSMPQSLIPGGSVDAARLVALRAGIDAAGESLGESPYQPFRLRIWFPTPHRQLPDVSRREFPTHVHSAVQAKRGILAYVGTVVGSRNSLAMAMVIDAKTGAVLEITHPFQEGSAGGAGGGAPSLPKPTATDLSKPHTWRIGLPPIGWSSWSVPAVDRLTPSKGLAPKETVAVTLAWDKRAMKAIYAPKANVLVVDGQTYQPGTSLSKLLRKNSGKIK